MGDEAAIPPAPAAPPLQLALVIVPVDRRFLGSDERRSIISVTDGSGTVLGLNKYDEYGNPQSSNTGAFGYTGQAWLPSMGVWYYKARVFDAELGRFLQTDPIDVEGGINLYAYVGNNPVNWTDPLGLQTTEIWVKAGWSCATQPAMCADASGPGGPSQWNSGSSNSEGSDQLITVVGKRLKRAGAKARSSICRAGNSMNFVADKAGGVSWEIAKYGGGILVAGAVSGRRDIAMGGAGLLAVSGGFGVVSGSLQCLGGAFQAAAGRSSKNFWAGCGSLGTGALIARGLKASIPTEWRGMRYGDRHQRAMENNTIVGNAIGLSQNLIVFLTPTQVSCG